MTTTERDAQRDEWGQLSHPVHQKPLHDGPEPWRDNAFLAFWDPVRELFGIAHVSTSPNAEGRRAQCCVLAGGQRAEVGEALEPGTFTSRSISFDLAASSITVNSPQLSVALRMTPRNVPADYSDTKVIPELVEGVPLRHFQQGVGVRGTVKTEAGPVDVDGHGVRVRTWGVREDSTAFPEYAVLMACLPEYDVTVMKFRGRDGSVRAHGFLLHPDHAEPVYRVDLNRDAAGLIDGAVLHTGESHHVRLTMRSGRGGLFVPMGPGGPPPVLSAYDDAVDVETDDGQVGAGFTEQGVLRQI